VGGKKENKEWGGMSATMLVLLEKNNVDVPSSEPLAKCAENPGWSFGLKGEEKGAADKTQSGDLRRSKGR